MPLVKKLLDDINIELTEDEINSIIYNGKDQRSVMQKTIRAIANKIII